MRLLSAPALAAAVVTDRFARTDGSTTHPCVDSEQTYCGGTWQGIIQQLDYIQELGATAVWISPFVKNIDGKSADGESYHGYWTKDIWNVNPSFGTPEDLRALSDAVHARGMYLMADVVTNHMAWIGKMNSVDYSTFSPFNNASAYHTPPCWINYDNQTSVERCWQGSDAVPLPDLRTEDGIVRQVFNNWIKRMVSQYGFDGLRLDSAKHVEKSFWSGFETAAGVFSIGEVFHGDPKYVAPYQDYMGGVMNYPAYYWITQAFQSTTGSIWNLRDGIKTLGSTARDLTLYGSFLENHDQARFLHSTADLALLKHALTLTLPRHLPGPRAGLQGRRDTLQPRGALAWIKKLIGLRSTMSAQDGGYLFYKALPIYTDSHIIAMRKGFDDAQVVSVYANVGGNSTFGVALGQAETGFRPCKLIMEITKCKPFVTDSSGVLQAHSGTGEPLVFVPAERVMGTGICPGGIGKPPPPPPPSRARRSTSSESPSATATIAFERTDYNLDYIGRFNNMTSSC
uniref:alpha-amylase n=1 Tax=Colletotrichum fructicola (strain Nara gc5) TaxID=1213859 RepID=L2G7U0_COLFN